MAPSGLHPHKKRDMTHDYFYIVIATIEGDAAVKAVTPRLDGVGISDVRCWIWLKLVNCHLAAACLWRSLNGSHSISVIGMANMLGHASLQKLHKYLLRCLMMAFSAAGQQAGRVSARRTISRECVPA